MRGHRTSNYARVMLTSYPYHLRDVGDIFADVMGNALGEAAKFAEKPIRMAQQLNKDLNLQRIGSGNDGSGNDGEVAESSDAVTYVTVGVITVAGVVAALALGKMLSSRGSK